MDSRRAPNAKVSRARLPDGDLLPNSLPCFQDTTSTTAWPYRWGRCGALNQGGDDGIPRQI
jgi:hypothetical protein